MPIPIAVAVKAKKGFTLPLLLALALLFACSPSKWCIETPCPSQGRIFSPSKECVSFELIRSGGKDWGYVNNIAFGFTPPMAEVGMTVEGQTYLFYGQVLGGFQRLLLPEEATQVIVDSLLAGRSVRLSVAGYEAFLYPYNFALLYGRMN